MKKETDIVIIGGGVIGASLLYGLAKHGKKDTTLLEAGLLASGISGCPSRALSLLPRRISHYDMASAQYFDTRHFHNFERSSGEILSYYHMSDMQKDASLMAFGNYQDEFSLSLLEDITRYRGASLYSQTQIKDKQIPFIASEHADFLHYAEYIPRLFKPKDTVTAYAKTAKFLGAHYHENHPVTGLLQQADGRWKISTPHGDILAKHVVNAAGLYASEIAAMAGLSLPLRCVEHDSFMIGGLEEFFPKENTAMNFMSFSDDFYFFMQYPDIVLNLSPKKRRIVQPDASKLSAEPQKFDEKDFSHIKEDLERLYQACPVFRGKIRQYIRTALPMTPDGHPLMGPAHGKDNFWLACGFKEGFSQTSIVETGLAKWLADGETPLDTESFDPARFAPEEETDFITARVIQNQNFVKADAVWDGSEPVREHPLMQNYKTAGALLIRKNDSVTPLAFGTQTHLHDTVNIEQMHMRKQGGFYDIGHHAKIEITGKDAKKLLEFISASRLPEPGETVYSALLKQNGYLQAVFSIACIAQNRYWLIGTGGVSDINLRHLQTHAGGDVTVRNLTREFGGIAIAGAQAEKIYQKISDVKLPFFGVTIADFQGIELVIVRFSITGENGYELYCLSENLPQLYQFIKSHADALEMRPIGHDALHALRLEKGYPIWGEIAACDHALIAGMEKHIDFSKHDFCGRDAVCRQRDAEITPQFFHARAVFTAPLIGNDFSFNSHKNMLAIDDPKVKQFFDITSMTFCKNFPALSMAYAASSQKIYGLCYNDARRALATYQQKHDSAKITFFQKILQKNISITFLRHVSLPD